MHTPIAHSYFYCLDILDNAANLLDLFCHLDLEENGEHGGIKALQHSVFLATLQQSTGNQQIQVCNNIASLLNINPADIKTFLGMFEPQDNSANNVKERTGVYLVQ